MISIVPASNIKGENGPINIYWSVSKTGETTGYKEYNIRDLKNNHDFFMYSRVLYYSLVQIWFHSTPMQITMHIYRPQESSHS